MRILYSKLVMWMIASLVSQIIWIKYQCAEHHLIDPVTIHIPELGGYCSSIFVLL